MGTIMVPVFKLQISGRSCVKVEIVFGGEQFGLQLKLAAFGLFVPISDDPSPVKNDRIENSIGGESSVIVLFRQNFRAILVTEQIFVVGRQQTRGGREIPACPTGAMDIPFLPVMPLCAQFRSADANSPSDFPLRQAGPPENGYGNNSVPAAPAPHLCRYPALEQPVPP